MVPGDPGLGPGGQGYGPRRHSQPPAFGAAELGAALDFFGAEGYCVLADVLAAAELGQLHAFMDRSQAAKPAAWGIDEPGEAGFSRANTAAAGTQKRGVKAKLSNVLLEQDGEVDWCARLPMLLSFADGVFGERNARHAEINLRETPSNQVCQMT